MRYLCSCCCCRVHYLICLSVSVCSMHQHGVDGEGGMQLCIQRIVLFESMKYRHIGCHISPRYGVCVCLTLSVFWARCLARWDLFGMHILTEVYRKTWPSSRIFIVHTHTYTPSGSQWIANVFFLLQANRCHSGLLSRLFCLSMQWLVPFNITLNGTRAHTHIIVNVNILL